MPTVSAKQLLRSATVFIFARAKITPLVLAATTARKPLWAEIRQLLEREGDNRTSQIGKVRRQNGNFLAGTTFAFTEKPKEPLSQTTGDLRDTTARWPYGTDNFRRSRTWSLSINSNGERCGARK
jgi:hypothetical protein